VRDRGKEEDEKRREEKRREEKKGKFDIYTNNYNICIAAIINNTLLSSLRPYVRWWVT